MVVEGRRAERGGGKRQGKGGRRWSERRGEEGPSSSPLPLRLQYGAQGDGRCVVQVREGASLYSDRDGLGGWSGPIIGPDYDHKSIEPYTNEICIQKLKPNHALYMH